MFFFDTVVLSFLRRDRDLTILQKLITWFRKILCGYSWNCLDQKILNVPKLKFSVAPFLSYDLLKYDQITVTTFKRKNRCSYYIIFAGAQQRSNFWQRKKTLKRVYIFQGNLKKFVSFNLNRVVPKYFQIFFQQDLSIQNIQLKRFTKINSYADGQRGKCTLCPSARP